VKKVTHRIEIACWKHGHVSELFQTIRQEQKLARQIPKLKAVCPKCKELEGVNEAITILNGKTLFTPVKPYVCRHGHLSLVSPLGKMSHVQYGLDAFVNVEGDIEELAELIDSKDISCYHDNDKGRRCGCKLKAINDTQLHRPIAPGIKTRTRMGDLMDRAGLEPVRPNKVNTETGEIEESKTEKANIERLKRIRKNRRNMQKDRHPGTRIDKPTDTDYGRKSKDQVKSKW
jgi:hypothetical protein